MRDVVIEYLNRVDILTEFATGADLNRDLERLWDHLARGGWCHHFPDVLLMTHTGKWLLRDADDLTALTAVAASMDIPIERYSVGLRLRQYVSP